MSSPSDTSLPMGFIAAVAAVKQIARDASLYEAKPPAVRKIQKSIGFHVDVTDWDEAAAHAVREAAATGRLRIGLWHPEVQAPAFLPIELLSQFVGVRRAQFPNWLPPRMNKFRMPQVFWSKAAETQYVLPEPEYAAWRAEEQADHYISVRAHYPPRGRGRPQVYPSLAGAIVKVVREGRWKPKNVKAMRRELYNDGIRKTEDHRVAEALDELHHRTGDPAFRRSDRRPRRRDEPK